MVTFAPEVQQSPDIPYINWARPTQEPKPNVAVGEALKGTASAIREGSQGLTAAYEKGIQNTIYAGVDSLRDEYMETLHTADQALRSGQAPDPLGRDAPRDVKQLPMTLDKFDSARANGKLSQTDYDARLNSLAKEIRAKYPGFRQYVDEEFKRVTGRDSANQYIRSVIGDIDSFIAGRQAKRDALEGRLMSEGLKFPGAAAMIEAYKKDPERNGHTALQWLNDHMSADHAVQEHRADIAAMEAENKLSTEVEGRRFSQFASNSSKPWWNAAGTSLVSHFDLNNPQYKTHLQAIERGEIPTDIGDEEATALGSYLNAQGQQAKIERARQLREAATPQASGGPAQSTLGDHPVSSITDKQIHDQVEEEHKMYFQPYIDALTKGDVPLALRHKQMVEGRKDDVAQAFMTDPVFRQLYPFLDTLKKEDPNLYQAVTSQMDAQVYPHLIPSIVKAMKEAVDPPQAGGKPFTDIIQNAQAQNIKDGNFYKSLTQIFTTLGKTGKNSISDEAADSLIQNLYGDPNGGRLLQYFVNDGYVARGGGEYTFPVLGRQYVFNQAFSDDIIKRVAKRAKDNPTFYPQMEAMAEANARTLMPRDYLQAPPQGVDSGSIPGMANEYHYNDQNYTFSVNKGPSGFIPREFKQEFDQEAANIKRLATIAQHEPNGASDPNRRIIEHLVALRPEPGSIAYKMLQAIVATRMQHTEDQSP